MPRQRIHIELTPDRKYKFEKVKRAMRCSSDSQVIDNMLEEFIKIIDNDEITKISYLNLYNATIINIYCL